MDKEIPTTPESKVELINTYSKEIIPTAMDYISALPIAFVFANIFEAVHGGNVIEMTLFTVVLLGSDLFTLGIKEVSKHAPESLNFMLHRPLGAYNTDVLSRNGPKPYNAPGFPSGHMTVATLFAVYRIIKLYEESGSLKNVLKKPLQILFYVSIIVSMAVARWYKRSHTPIQIAGGFIFGAVVAFLFRGFVKKYL